MKKLAENASQTLLLDNQLPFKFLRQQIFIASHMNKIEKKTKKKFSEVEIKIN